MKREHKITASYQEIFYKGTVTLLTTLGAGALFGRDNMMIAFVLALGSGALAAQNLRIKTFYKTFRLIFIDVLIVYLAYIASLNIWSGILINLVTIFAIVYLNVSPYNQMTYKTFMMLYVFCQYTSVLFIDLPKRVAMVIFAVSIVVVTIYIEQNKIKALLPPQIGRAFKLLYQQLILMTQGKFDKEISQKVSYEMNELAYVIYGSSFRRYFTTYIGKVNFHFYLNVSYFNFLLEQINKQKESGLFSKAEISEIGRLFKEIQSYFERKIKREELIQQFEAYLKEHVEEDGFKDEVTSSLYALNKNFKELDEFSTRKKDKVYNEWKRSDLGNIKNRVRQYFRPKAMSFNFAARMSIILTIGLLLAHLLGFYKFIWAIIPIMSITQPYVEDTNKRKIDRLESNILAAVLVTIILNVIRVHWITFALLVVAFYLYYAYKDYYHASLFLTIISMCISTVNAGINTLLFYRIIYVLLGVTVVGITSRFIPYRLEDGINELIIETEQLNSILEEESLLSIEGKADLNRIREAIIYSAVLCQKMYLKNKQYQNAKVDYLIHTNTEFVVRLGHRILRDI